MSRPEAYRGGPTLTMESLRVALPALVLILVYLVGINVLGGFLGRGQKDARDYFLGNHSMPWWAVMGSIVATETSALTFLSVAGDAYHSGFTFLQLVFGYIVGRIAVSRLLLPAYFEGELATAYQLLEKTIRRRGAPRHIAALHDDARDGGRCSPGGSRNPDRAHLECARSGRRS